MEQNMRLHVIKCHCFLWLNCLACFGKKINDVKHVSHTENKELTSRRYHLLHQGLVLAYFTFFFFGSVIRFTTLFSFRIIYYRKGIRIEKLFCFFFVRSVQPSNFWSLKFYTTTLWAFPLSLCVCLCSFVVVVVRCQEMTAISLWYVQQENCLKRFFFHPVLTAAGADSKYQLIRNLVN